MKQNISLIAIGFLVCFDLIAGYRVFAEEFGIKPKNKVSEESKPELIPEITFPPTLPPTPIPTVTYTPKPTLKPIPTNTSTPTPLPNTNNQRSNSGGSSYEEWSAKDSKGVLCINPNSRCKYECSVADFYVDDQLRILNNHLWEYQMHLKIYGPDSSNTKIWEDAVIKMYNTIYEECKNSPIYNPQNPL